MQRVNSLRDNWQKLGAFPLVSILAISADQISKLLIRHNLSLDESLPEEGIFRLTYVANEGVVFGLSAPRMLPLILSALVIIAACFFYYKYLLSNSRLAKIALGLIVGGSIGNLVDRLHLGHVVDFIDIRLWGDYHWPTFNLADTAIVIGAILLIYFLVYSYSKKLQKPS